MKHTYQPTVAGSKPKSRGGCAKQATPILFHASSDDPDMLYFSRFQVSDPYLAFSVDGKRVAVTHAMEYGRMVKESAFDEILLLNEVRDGASKRFKLSNGKEPDTAQLVLHLAKLYEIPNFRVGPRFPIGLGRKLREAGMTLEIADGCGLFPERQIKTAAEVEALRKGNRASEAGFRIVAKTLAESKIRNGKLVHGGSILTSERLRELISHATLDAGAVTLQTIVSPGDQAVDNHCLGHGPIRPGELIVVDIFPRRSADGYWGDMTRTYLKGRASDAQRRLVRTVKRAHQLAIDMIKPGVVSGKVHDAVQTEKGRADRLTADCWLTDDTISRGSWSYTEGLEIKPTRQVLHSLIDIVSKNGCMLLNISPKADGGIPDNQRQVLLEMGEWLRVNGEAIYETRPWTRYGEGPTQLARGGHFIKEVAYTAQDIRYTRSKDDLTLYAITLGIPEPDSTISLASVRNKVHGITLLGSNATIAWERTKDGLRITMPESMPNEMALVFRIDKSFE